MSTDDLERCQTLEVLHNYKVKLKKSISKSNPENLGLYNSLSVFPDLEKRLSRCNKIKSDDKNKAELLDSNFKMRSEIPTLSLRIQSLDYNFINQIKFKSPSKCDTLSIVYSKDSIARIELSMSNSPNQVFELVSDSPFAYCTFNKKENSKYFRYFTYLKTYEGEVINKCDKESLKTPNIEISDSITELARILDVEYYKSIKYANPAQPVRNQKNIDAAK